MFRPTNPKAFTMFEILVTIFLIGVFVTVLGPRLSRRSPAIEWQSIVDDLNDIVSFTRQESISNQSVYRITFKTNAQTPDIISIEQEQPDPEKPGRKIYVPVTSYYFPYTTYSLAPAVKIKAVYLGKHDMLDEGRGVAYCYVVPDGLIQEVLVHLVRKIETTENIGSFKMHPFFGRFEFEEGLVKPER